ncbi:GNAT family N-acetyltransferase [uncultured Friedmanniella sp.]|uniref:GNAT family N-acetyltransferase n=1 Tax=uncultured Friedmanniella sp. TaxID=335381 RepID=UPI0035CAF0B7
MIELVRLTEVPLEEVLALLNEPRNAPHMPLASSFTAETAAAWVAAKDGQWVSNGHGPWAVLVDGEFAGWCGFQREPAGEDFALVLAPPWWGHGSAVLQQALGRGFGELGLGEVLIALPLSRRAERVLSRFGFLPDGEVSYGGAEFRQYRLTRERWSSSERGQGARVLDGGRA